MKRKREQIEKGRTEIMIAMEEISLVYDREDRDNNNISSQFFLSVSKQLLRVLDKIGPTFLVLRHDIQKNIQRIEDFNANDKSRSSSLTEIILKETDDGTVRKANSCTRALIWLTRSINFTVALLETLINSPNLTLEETVKDAYNNTLKPWHGWISTAACKVALKLIPEREYFISLLLGKCKDFEDLKEDIRNMMSMLQPPLDEMNSLLAKHELEKLKST
ncbi:Glycolipid transfer family protein [Rhynchospora pubera]|uniref:Glycolipid transfer family protein n=1 Tax=Rhynchospora pubera TaxID=906938 RepID=A0AAV8GFU2_9POAL|nr:Glycolipid transfer family protein [Rhynchospora pubera]